MCAEWAWWDLEGGRATISPCSSMSAQSWQPLHPSCYEMPCCDCRGETVLYLRALPAADSQG